jgi:hypothetical protein
MRLWAISLLFIAVNTYAQAPAPAPQDRLHAYIITMGPGGEVYELFGHNMIWIHVPASGSEAAYDAAYNWGEFSFKEQNFIWKFVQGRMIYSMNTRPYDATRVMDAYRGDDRSIWVQELNLTQEQIAGLLNRLEINELPNNATYRYDYYRDNCSTRVRDAIDATVDGQIKAATKDVRTGHTFRWHTRRLTRSTFWLYTALDFLMGHPTDQELSRWEEMFIPMAMMDHLREIKLANGQPLIVGERQEYQSKRFFEANSPPRWFLGMYFAMGLLVGALLAFVTQKRIGARTLWAVVAIAWCLLGSIAGVISTWAWFFTDHHDARYNENWLQLTPFVVAMLFLIPLMLKGKRRAGVWAFWFACGFAVLSVLGLLLKVLPVFYQYNIEILALTIPANIGLAWGMWKMRVVAGENNDYLNTRLRGSLESRARRP